MKCDYLLLHHHIVDYKLHLASRTLYMWISLDYYIDSQQRKPVMAVTMFMVSRFDSADGMQAGIPIAKLGGGGTKKIFCWKMYSE